jgi:CrcB protein
LGEALMPPVLYVAIGGAIGAPLRYVVDSWVQRKFGPVFPWGTFVINISGSLLLGFITGLALYHGFPNAPKILIGTGFCGAYTTFSTFVFESVALGKDGTARLPVLNVFGSVLAGLAAAAVGLLFAAAV